MFLLFSTEAEKLSPIDMREECRNGVGGSKRKRKHESVREGGDDPFLPLQAGLWSELTQTDISLPWRPS